MYQIKRWLRPPQFHSHHSLPKQERALYVLAHATKDVSLHPHCYISSMLRLQNRFMLLLSFFSSVARSTLGKWIYGLCFISSHSFNKHNFATIGKVLFQLRNKREMEWSLEPRERERHTISLRWSNDAFEMSHKNSWILLRGNFLMMSNKKTNSTR